MSWQKVADILKAGGVVIIPSDSSYGIAALASSKSGVERVYKIKGRESDKPSLLIVGSMDQAKRLVKFTKLAEKLAKKFWPGGLTLVLEAKDTQLSPLIYGEDKSLAIRFPNHPKLKWLAQDVGPFILPSANFSGENPPFSSDSINPKLKEVVDFTLDEPTDGNSPSTIVDARGDKAVILRAGSLKI